MVAIGTSEPRMTTVQGKADMQSRAGILAACEAQLKRLQAEKVQAAKKRAPQELQTTSRGSDNYRVCSAGNNPTTDAETPSSRHCLVEGVCYGAGAEAGREVPAVHVPNQFINTPEVEDAVKAIFTGMNHEEICATYGLMMY